MVKTPPCRFKPYRKSGILSISKNTERVNSGGVICDKRIDVPEIPLSYKLTGAKNIVTPIAFIIPEIVKQKSFLYLVSLKMT